MIEPDRNKIAFIMFTHLSSGAGSERTVSEYCRYLPSDMEATVVQMDNPKGDKPISSYRGVFDKDNVKLITVRGFDQKFNFLYKSKFTSTFLLFIIFPVLFRLLKYTY